MAISPQFKEETSLIEARTQDQIDLPKQPEPIDYSPTVSADIEEMLVHTPILPE